MKITYDGFTFDEKVIQTIEDKCFMVKAHDYNHYLHDSNFGGKNIIQILKDIKFEKEFKICNPQEKQLNLTIDKQKEIVINFYKSLNNELGKIAENILFEKDSRYCVNISQDTSKDCSGNVSTQNNSNLIHINVNLDGGLRGLRILAHELSHAMSGFKTKAYDVINNGTETEQNEYFSHLGKSDVDSIGEIESHIVELLFMNYLTNKNIITEEDLINYENKRNNSIINNINTILEESYILDQIPPPITPEKFEKFENKIGGLLKSKKHYNTIMHRFISMFQRDDHSGYSKYDFRYVVGDVVSTLWFEQYSQASEQQKKKMIDTFEKFLAKTDSANLETACHDLVDMGVGETFDDYICYLQGKMFER